MATVGKPDLAQYRTRLKQILTAVSITLPDGMTSPNVFKAPGLGQSVYPYWVLGRPTVTSTVEAVRIRRWRVSWVFFLARGTSSQTEKVEGLADQIDDDVADVMEYFESRSEFVSSTLTDNQAGYLPGTLLMSVNPDAAMTTKLGPVTTTEILGSAYTLSLTHRVLYDMQYR